MLPHPQNDNFLDAHLKPLIPFFLGRDESIASKHFFLPTYQRPYSWEKPQWEDFWNDLRQAQERNPDLPYLLGTLYLAQVAPDELVHHVNPEICAAIAGDASTAYLVIDGQQRLTTLFLLLLADGERRSELWSGNQPRLHPGHIDHAFFRAMVENRYPDPETRSHQRLQKALEFFHNRLKSLTSEQRILFRRFIENRLQAVIILLVRNLELATTLFVSQTDRGRRLSVLDRLKSTLTFYTFQERNSKAFGEIIDSLFGDIYRATERLAKLRVYARAEDAESDVLRILHVRLRLDQFYETCFRKISGDKPKLDIGWEIGEEHIYEGIGTALRQNDAEIGNCQRALELVIKRLEEIRSFFKYLAETVVLEREGQFLDVFDHRPWYPYLSLLGSIGLNRFSLSVLAILWADVSQNPGLFFDPRHPQARVESIFQVLPSDQPKPLGEIEIFQRKLQRLLEGLSPRRKDAKVDFAVIGSIEPVRQFLVKELDQALKRVHEYDDFRTTEFFSVTNLLERLEVSIWKLGKNPHGSFPWFHGNSQNWISQLLAFANYYKSVYQLRDTGFGQAKYLLFEYERLIARNQDDHGIIDLLDMDLSDEDGVEIQREHIFPVTPPTDRANLLDRLWHEAGDAPYHQWIWGIGNIVLLEHGINIGEASNRDVVDKAECYLDSTVKLKIETGDFQYRGTRFVATQNLAKTIIELDRIIKTTTQFGTNTNLEIRYFAYKVLLEIRELELLGFLYCRF